jgi:hypothetical protein
LQREEPGKPTLDPATAATLAAWTNFDEIMRQKNARLAALPKAPDQDLVGQMNTLLNFAELCDRVQQAIGEIDTTNVDPNLVGLMGTYRGIYQKMARVRTGYAEYADRMLDPRFMTSPAGRQIVGALGMAMLEMAVEEQNANKTVPDRWSSLGRAYPTASFPEPRWAMPDPKP